MWNMKNIRGIRQRRFIPTIAWVLYTRCWERQPWVLRTLLLLSPFTLFQLWHRPQCPQQRDCSRELTWRIVWSQDSFGGWSHLTLWYVLDCWASPVLTFLCWKSLAPLGKIWDPYLSHCPVLCILRTMFNPLVLEASSAKDPEFQYVHNLGFLVCIFSEILVYEYITPVLGNVDFLLPQICSRKRWRETCRIYWSVPLYPSPSSPPAEICFLCPRFMVEVMMIFQEWD